MQLGADVNMRHLTFLERFKERAAARLLGQGASEFRTP
jgi:hypothetical protein